MKRAISKTEATKEIEEFFSNTKSKTPKEVKKIKRLAMSHSIKLKDKRKLFCKKCLSSLEDSQIRIKKGMKIVKCKNCKEENRWGMK